jgi:hypothetical protein
MAPYYRIIIPTLIILSVVNACGYIEPENPSVTPMEILTPSPTSDPDYDVEGRKLEYEEIEQPIEGSDEGERYEIPKWDTDQWDWYEEHTVSSSPVPSIISLPELCIYTSLRNVNCRGSDYAESSLIAILMQGEEAKLLYLNPTFTHGKFELAAEQQCWIALWLMDGPEEPYKTCQISVVDAPPSMESSDPDGSDSPVCSLDLDEDSCKAAGGTWGGAVSPTCNCP